MKINNRKIDTNTTTLQTDQ